MSAPRKEFLALAEKCGATLTDKPDGSEAVTVVFSIEAWRAFDAAMLERQIVRLTPSHEINYDTVDEIAVRYSIKYNHACALVRDYLTTRGLVDKS